MKLKMLTGLSGRDFSLSPGEETDRFGDKEAKRLIKDGYAEVAPPKPVKKPETKKEWDKEREELLAENAQIKADLAEAAAREEALAAKAELVDKASAAFGEIFGLTTSETTEAPAARETRG